MEKVVQLPVNRLLGDRLNLGGNGKPQGLGDVTVEAGNRVELGVSGVLELRDGLRVLSRMAGDGRPLVNLEGNLSTPPGSAPLYPARKRDRRYSDGPLRTCR